MLSTEARVRAETERPRISRGRSSSERVHYETTERRAERGGKADDDTEGDHAGTLTRLNRRPRHTLT